MTEHWHLLRCGARACRGDKAIRCCIVQAAPVQLLPPCHMSSVMCPSFVALVTPAHALVGFLDLPQCT